MHTTAPPPTALRTYLDGLSVRGALAEMARALGIERVYLSQLAANDRKPSPKLCAAIERVTGGRLTCEELRPDIVWHRVSDAEWPHHPSGRPVLEVVDAEEARDAA